MTTSQIEWASNFLARFSGKEPSYHEEQLRETLARMWDFEVEVGYCDGACIEAIDPLSREYRILIDVSFLMKNCGNESSCNKALSGL